MMADQFHANSELERLHFKVERLHQRLNELENGRSVVASAVSGADDRLEDDRTTRGAEVLGVSKARKDSCAHMDERKEDVAQPTSGASTKKKVNRRKPKKMNGDPARNWEAKYLEGENTDACAPLARPSGYAQAGGLSDTSADDGDASADDGEESDDDDSSDGESDADLDILLDDLRNKPLMRRCRWIAAHPRFNRLILLCIIINSVVLAFDDPLRVTPPAWMRLVESALAVVYVVEVTIKLIAWRLLFFRSAFNTLDFLVAFEGAVSTLLLETTGGGGGLEGLVVLRMLRLVRPLRTLQRFSGVRVVVNAIAKSLPGVGVVLIILILWLGVYALFAMALWSGTLNSRCEIDPVDDDVTSDLVVCRANTSKSSSESGALMCGLFEWVVNLIACPADGLCIDTGVAPNGGFESFDDWPRCGTNTDSRIPHRFVDIISETHHSPRRG